MSKFRRFGVISAVALLATAGSAFAGTVSVGRFYLEIAKAKNLVVADAPAAEAGLRRAGVELPQLPLDKSLTEGDVKAISTSLGLTVNTDRPSDPISEKQLSTFMSSFANQIAAPGLRNPDPAQAQQDLPPQAGKGKGKKKGHHKSSSEPI